MLLGWFFLSSDMLLSGMLGRTYAIVSLHICFNPLWEWLNDSLGQTEILTEFHSKLNRVSTPLRDDVCWLTGTEVYFYN